MRKLATVSLSFAAAALLVYYLLDYRYAPIAAGICLLACFGAFLWYGEQRTRYLLIALGLAAGFLWSWGYDVLFTMNADALAGQTVSISMTALDYSETESYGTKVEARVKLDGRCDAYVYFFDVFTDIEPGDTVKAEVTFKRPDELFKGGNDIYAQRGVALTGSSDTEPTVIKNGFNLRYLPNYASKLLRDKIKEIFPDNVRAFMLALLTGDRNELNEDEILIGALSRAGISHVVAVSGMHLSFICEFIALIVRKKRRVPYIAIPAVLFFMAMTGFTPSVTRAGIMQMFVFAAPMFKRESDSVTSLSAALLIILLVNPNAAGNAGLQMSFSATLGLILVSGRIYDAIYHAAFKKKKRGKAVRWIIHFVIATFSSTLGALIFTVPLSAVHFGSISVAAPIVNLLTAPAVSVAFIGGYIACLAGFVFAPMGAVLAKMISIAPRYVIGIARLFSRVTLLSASAKDPIVLIWLIYIYIMLIVFIAFRPKVRDIVTPVTLAAVSLCVVIVITAVRPQINSEGLTFTVLDVGQGLCCVAESGGEAAVIDCGSSSGEYAGDIAVSYLRSRGYTDVDLLVLTHFHSDHCNGAERLIAGLNVGAVMCPEKPEEDDYRADGVISTAEDAGTEVICVTEDLSAALGDITIEIYAPVDDESENERGLSILVSCGDYDVLITGDAGFDTEKKLMKHAHLPDIETLVVGHHGSRYSTGYELLKKLKPETAIISVGENSYGHPNEYTLDRLREYGVEIFRTDECGNVTVCSQ